MPADHLDIFSYSFTLSASPPSRAGFGKPLLIAALATNSLNGATTLEFTSRTEAQASLTAGYIAQATFDQIESGFLQTSKPSAIKVGAVDLVGAETWAQAYTRIRQADPDFWAVLATSRTPADIVSLATAVEADDDRFFFFQNSDADWLTTGDPASFSAIGAFERSALLYHDDDTEYVDMGWVADRVSADPDVNSADWKTLLKTGASLTTGLSQTQKDFLIKTNHGNVMLPLGPTYQRFVSPGINLNNRGIYELLSVDWFRSRTQEDYSQLLVEYANRHRKLVVGQAGQTAVQGILQKWLKKGVAAQHFLNATNTRVTAHPITADDRTNGVMRFKVEATFAISARELEFDIYFQQTELEVA